MTVVTLVEVGSAGVTVKQTSSQVGQEARKAAEGKHTKYDNILKDTVDFRALAMDTSCYFCDEAYEVAASLSRKVALHHLGIAQSWKGGVNAYSGHVLSKFMDEFGSAFYRCIGNIVGEYYPNKMGRMASPVVSDDFPPRPPSFLSDLPMRELQPRPGGGLKDVAIGSS